MQCSRRVVPYPLPKRLLDRAVAAALLVLSSPIFLFVLVAMAAISALGVVLIAAGVVAALVGSSLSVVMLLLVAGVVMAMVFGLGLPSARRTYADAELRRMRAMDEG